MRIILVVFVLMLAACQIESRTNSLQVGMSKAEVIKIMGNPVATKAADGTETLVYRLYDIYGKYREYFVRLHDGKVDAYGKQGDLDPSINLKVETH